MRVGAMLVLLIQTGVLARPQPRGSAAPPSIEKLERLSPNERRKLLDHLPPDRARRLEKQLDNYEHLSPDERERLAERYEWFRSLPPERQERMRKVFSRYEALPKGRQDAVRREFNSLRDMSEAQRRERTSSKEFRSRYSKDEQKLIEEMAKTVPR